MSEIAMTEFSTERCHPNLPYEVLFEIFSGLSKDKLMEISSLCSTFRNVAEDARFWKDVWIQYKPNEPQTLSMFAFEELYSMPGPVKAIDLSLTEINPPVSAKTDDQVVEVTKLVLSDMEADKVTYEAILARYRCKELYLDGQWVDLQGNVMGIAPKAFSNQTALEVLSLRDLQRNNYVKECGGITVISTKCHLWLAEVLGNFKNLKSLDLGFTDKTELFDFAKHLPTSLETLLLTNVWLEDDFFNSLPDMTPKLKELGMRPDQTVRVRLPSLLKLQFLETLHIIPISYHYADLSRHLIKYPALKTVYTYTVGSWGRYITQIERLRSTLEPHGIRVADFEWPRFPEVEGHLWMVSKAIPSTVSPENSTLATRECRLCSSEAKAVQTIE